MEKYTSIVKEENNTYVVLETTVNHYDTLLGAMKAQAAKNKEICDEIIRKAELFDEELKRYDNK